jgi:O-antigen ligase
MSPDTRVAAVKPALAPAAFLGVWAAMFGLAPTTETRMLALVPVVLGAVGWWVILKPERWLALFFVCCLLLPPLPFPFGNSGIHIAPLIALLGLVAGGVRITGWQVPETNRSRALPLLFVLFLAVLAGSTAFAAFFSGWEIAMGSFARALLFGVGVYVFLYTLLGPRDSDSDPFTFARFLFVLGLLGAIFACLDFYFQFPAPAGYGAQYVWLAQSVVRRAQGVFYEASTLGNFCAFFLVMILVAFFHPASFQGKGRHGKGRQIIPRALLIPGALVFVAALIFSSSRASIVNVAVAGCAFVYVRRLSIGRVLPVVAAFLVSSAAIVRFALPEFSATYWSRMATSAQYIWSSPDGVLSGRLTHWNTLTDFLMQHPWHLIFGIGYKTIPYTDYLGAGVVADNTYLSLLVETGVIGLALFLALNGAILRTAYRAARAEGSRASFFGAWIFCFWCGEMVQMFSGDLITYWRVLPLYFWVLATATREQPGEHT